MAIQSGASKFKILHKNNNKHVLMDNMARRNDLLAKNPNFLTKLIQHEQPNHAFSILANVLGDLSGGSKENTFDIRGTGTSFIRIREQSFMTSVPRIIDDSLVPSQIMAGQRFELGVDTYFDEDSILLAKDRSTYLIISKQPIFGGVRYTLELSGTDGETVLGSILKNGETLVQIANSKGEGSYTSNQFTDDGYMYSDLYNPMMITRYKLGATGSAMSDDNSAYVCECNEDGKTIQYYVDTPRLFIRQIGDALAKQMLFTRANFELNPTTGKLKIHNKSAQKSPYEDRPTYAGILQQWATTPYMDTLRLRSTPAETWEKLKKVMRELCERHGRMDIRVAAVCTNKAWSQKISDAFMWANKNEYNAQVIINVTDKESINVGFTTDQARFSGGLGRMVITPYNSGMSILPKEFGVVNTHNGIKLNSFDLDCYFVVMDDNTEGKSPITIYGKEAKTNYGDFNRMFVFGTSHGITGDGNNMTQAQLETMMKSGMDSMLNQDSLRLDNLVDGREYHFLTEHTVGCVVRTMQRVTLI